MQQTRTILLFSVFGLWLLLAALGAPQAPAWARSAETGVQSSVQAADVASLPGTLPTATPTPDPRRPEIYVTDAPLALYHELAIEHGLALSYRSKGVAPVDNNLLIQSKTISGVVTSITPNRWVQVSEKTFELGQAVFPNVVEVAWITSTLPISWRGIANIWPVNATNTGVSLVQPKQNITTSLSITKIFTDRVAATTAFTFTMRATPGVSADWGDVHPTQFTVNNGCLGASWAQNLSSRDRFSFTVPTSAIIRYADAPWEIRHTQEPKLLLVSGTIYGPICAQQAADQRRAYLPFVQR